MARNTQEDTSKTRKTLIDAARKLFVDKGFTATTIADICDASNYTKGALFHHFKSKEALFLEIWTDMENKMDTAAVLEVTRMVQISSDPYDSLLAGCRVFLDHVSQPDFQQIVHVDGPAVLGMKEWMKHDAGMGMRTLGRGLKYLASEGLIEEEERRALTVLAYGALQAMAKAISFPETMPKTTPEEMFKVFESLVRAKR